MPTIFRKVLIADERYEAAGVCDVDNDGVLDIVSGAWWYQGPDFRTRHHIGNIRAENEYYDDFSCIPLEVNGDGRIDYVTGGWFGKTLVWYENPGDPNKKWPVHEIAEVGNVETTRGWDIDGDGVLEIVPNTPNDPTCVFKLDDDAAGRGQGTFTKYVLREEKSGHGLGCGDVDGDGRCDLILKDGWLQQPAEGLGGEWLWHPEFDLGHASIPILCADVNGDGLNDLIVGQGHGYGLQWFEQRLDGDQRTWVPHVIDPDNSQYHDMQWVDIDGDGACELVTGKRYRAHNGGDPGALDPGGIYYFKWTGEFFIKQVIDWGPNRVGTGCGIHFAVADLSGDGRLDVVAPGKDGLYVFFNEGNRP